MTDRPFPQKNPVPSEYGTNPPRQVPAAAGVPAVPSVGDSNPASTTEVAKSQAGDVAGGAKDAAQQVAGAAKEQVGQVAQEARTQVKQVVGQAQAELSDQAQTQQTKAAGGLHSLGDQLAAMASGSDQPGMATDVAQQAADRAHQFAGWLENRDPQGVLDDVRSFARRKPGVFLIAAVGAGVLAGRLARGLSADSDATSSPSAGSPQAGRGLSTEELAGPAAAQLPSAGPSTLDDRLGRQNFPDVPARHRENLPGVDG